MDPRTVTHLAHSQRPISDLHDKSTLPPDPNKTYSSRKLPRMAAAATILAPGNTCCITGGASGIGFATAERCAAAGMNVCLADFELYSDALVAELTAALEAAGAASVLAIECDVSSLESMERVQSTVFEKFGGCHFLSLNAGIGGGGGVLAAEDRWRALIDVNLMGPALGLQAFLWPMQDSNQPGVISITGSREGITTPPSDIVYNVTKAAVRTLAESLEHELRSTPGSVLSARLLLPGMTATPIGYNTVKRVKGKDAADARAAKVGGDPAAMMGNAHPPSVVADLLCDSVDSGGPFYVICPGSTDVDEFKVSYQRHADDLIEQGPPLSQFMKPSL